ncbi:salivary peroxidase/catechol oxidase [Penaeus vannamei]|uniref:salivary peroxidase/catechol oxidase n=1 Tax=Penaeus vannamei TaxID=6689 RepID=UPI00387F615B
MTVFCVLFAVLLGSGLGTVIPDDGILEDVSGTILVRRGKRSYDQIVLNASMEEEQVSISYGQMRLREKEVIENELVSQQLTIPAGFPSYVHQNLLKSSHPSFAAAASSGYVTDHATLFLADQLRLEQHEVALKILLSEQLAQDQLCDQDLALSACTLFMSYRSNNGICNNLAKPFWGSILRPFRRVAPPHYGNGVFSFPTTKEGRPFPNARLVSLRVNDIQPNRESSLLSVLHMTYGEFLNHDLTFVPLNIGLDGKAIPCCPETQGSGSGDPIPHPECAQIYIPTGDTFYSRFNKTCLEFVRSAPALRCKFGHETFSTGPREQINEQTAHIDGSQIYSSINIIGNTLRTRTDGLLTTQTIHGEEFLPANLDTSNYCNKEEKADKRQYCFMAGDSRVNKHPLLVLLHTVWMRHHNHIASRLKNINPSWNDEKLFQEARRIVGAQLQHVTYNEYLPPIFGDEISRKFKLKPTKNRTQTHIYGPKLNAAISAEFATAAFRFRHSQIPGHMERADNLGDISFTETSSAYMDPFIMYTKDAMPQLLRGAVRQSATDVDLFFSRQVAGKLYKGHNMVGVDLVTDNIQRGRDHGIASYTALRNACRLSPITSFADLSGIMDDEVIDTFENLYSDVEDIELYVGGLAEHPVEGGIVGPTFACILLDQFLRLKHGDRFWYETEDDNAKFTEGRICQKQHFVFLVSSDAPLTVDYLLPEYLCYASSTSLHYHSIAPRHLWFHRWRNQRSIALYQRWTLISGITNNTSAGEKMAMMESYDAQSFAIFYPSRLRRRDELIIMSHPTQ